MTHLFHIIASLIGALLLIPIHGECSEIMEYESQNEIAVTDTSYSGDEDSIADAGTAVANPPVKAGYPATHTVIRSTSAPAKKFDFFARFCVFRE